ncbi:hypothetical protein C7C56_001955 [Massilia glaciei]|uniref:Uncharacterized protein n=1 Tax=Massilia glaciei TaxID=1524097 RepID=A0A2U2I6N2_9BURK|nr:hypothetical protein C7C56_001955 [Massilia glaciei]
MLPEQAAAIAIDEWIARAREKASPSRGGVRGYQWKCLFLPDGTDLRICCAGQSFYARVTGDHIKYEGRALSPRQFTLAVAGGGRNAWRELWVLLPGERIWKSADTLRRAQLQAPAPVSPIETMTVAAASMASALKTALSFVEHANAKAASLSDRRLGRSRRADDVLADHCSFD